jgi:hypothetical protein
MLNEPKRMNGPDQSKYVKGTDGDIISISEVNPADRYALGPYTCLSCGHLMVPALGTQRAHHFKHKAGRPIDCLHETYLHELAKLTVFSEISNAIKNGFPYHLKQMAPVECDYFSLEFDFLCRGRLLPAEIDLTELFDTVGIESGANGFVADVLLRSSKTEDVLAIEIAVTHPCEPEKIESGLSIVELKIRTEDDIEKVRTGIDPFQSSVSIYNLKPPPVVTQRCIEPCPKTVLVLLLYSTGKAWYSEHALASLGDLVSDPLLITWELGDAAGSAKIRNEREIRRSLSQFMVRQKYVLGKEVKSCLLCHHNGGQVSTNDIYCAMRETSVWYSSTASTCATYDPIEDIDEAKAFLGIS